eukprot:s553_g13.t1
MPYAIYDFSRCATGVRQQEVRVLRRKSSVLLDEGKTVLNPEWKNRLESEPLKVAARASRIFVEKTGNCLDSQMMKSMECRNLRSKSSKAGWIRFTVQLKANLSLTTRVEFKSALQKIGDGMILLKRGEIIGREFG